MKVHVLQCEIHTTQFEISSVVLGVYSSYEGLIRAAKELVNTDPHSRSYSMLFYDMKHLDYDANWTNDQQSLKFTKEQF